MKDYRPAALFIFVLALADGAIGMLFPIDYTYQSFSYVPLLSLAMMLLYLSVLDLKSGWIVSASTGLFMDLFFYQSFPIHLLLYLVLGTGQILFGHLVYSRKIQLLFSLFLLFMSEFIPYTIQYFLNPEVIEIHLWFYKMEMLTLIINGAGLLCLEEIWRSISSAYRNAQERKIQNSIRL